MSCTGLCVAKVYLLVFDIIFMITGVALLAFGAITVVSVVNLHDAYDDIAIFYVPYVLIAVGSVIIVLGIIGFIGAFKEIQGLLLMFIISLVIIFGLELILGVLCLVFSDQLEDEISKELKSSLRSYEEEPIMDTWDRVQSDLKCCGVDGYSDWGNITNSMYKKGQAPDSCCVYFSEGCGVKNNEQFHDKGCQEEILTLIEDNMFLLGALAIGSGLFQIIGMIATVVLYCSIKRKGEYV